MCVWTKAESNGHDNNANEYSSVIELVSLRLYIVAESVMKFSVAVMTNDCRRHVHRTNKVTHRSLLFIDLRSHT